MNHDTADRFLGLLQSFQLERLTAEEQEYFLSALTDEERGIVSARLGLGTERLSLERIVGIYGLPMARVVAMEMRCMRRLALQDHLRQSETAVVEH